MPLRAGFGGARPSLGFDLGSEPKDDALAPEDGGGIVVFT